ncbi:MULTISPECIES: UDP-N-acetylmuramoyl-tripeptide--D-alanyl-D-alanine ligase [Bacillus]|jgi:UDP-N-acetylmuramoyl-tripeptide--D-alanyl-D-alanine ligase|uniref:UDP-N-acetylmuramoyl-tripeptide--D-alanyl-D-alanine ligase n=2 Tax=Bacillus cereus group TaxID=86661 RepID=A0AAP5L368_9BACI|nr:MULTISPECIES: UDP-N-acetylmuramoyl-tripeptide--D-alanyl-D-alanine ligase [Bacillus]MCU5156882.1 UDP-N-acetylmuramoyl-tripeptide--D-alanyl-D-alanine ligase [Bacillus pacificus]MCU9940734.1 UDP-N-acetylmuramoyl-tripeptide--D-alanyl-D-alanine ligase [Bacillus pacificus]MCX3298650.1 UDP-N-acetylmuramoyl-tripeptide--D-alanyl-D-alanine ligase [Bacillus pacificus]MCX3324951.1 UDP-N-acetylmuramoyl-tripeptide--D-alanyl-D-alanine ligase [Bacillus pacificus]MDA1688077.1 UDP-N-acetylmuramoyl-tripeptide
MEKGDTLIQMNLKKLEKVVNGEGLQESFHLIEMHGVCIDSKNMKEGNLFVPIIRVKDGHEYVKEAMDNGAVASLWKKSYGTPPKGIPIIFVDDTLFALQQLAQFYRRELNVKVIGITGSNGKTTVKDIIGGILSSTYRVHKTKGNFNSQIGLPLTILEMKRDTEFLILEMGMSEKGQIRNLSRIAQPDVAIITMIGQSHLETLGSREEIAKAKFEIIDGLNDDGLFLYNGDEPLLSQNINMLGIESKSFGGKYTNDLFPTNVQLDEYGVHFKLNNTKIQYDVPLHGKHNILNAIVGIAVGQFYKVPIEKIQEALQQINITQMRFQFLTAKTGFTIINDAWNASPSSMKAAIETLQKLNAYEKKIIVIGDMLELGKEAKTYHREIGKMLNEESIQYVFTYGALSEIVAEEARKNYHTEKVQSFDNKDEIAEEILKVITKKDVVLLKGSRGMALEEIVQNWM